MMDQMVGRMMDVEHLGCYNLRRTRWRRDGQPLMTMVMELVMDNCGESATSRSELLRMIDHRSVRVGRMIETGRIILQSIGRRRRTADCWIGRLALLLHDTSRRMMLLLLLIQTISTSLVMMIILHNSSCSRVMMKRSRRMIIVASVRMILMATIAVIAACIIAAGRLRLLLVMTDEVDRLVFNGQIIARQFEG